MRATGGNIEPVYTISPERKEIATEWVHVLPGASGVLFRLRHAGQGPADFEIMAMALPHGTAHSLVRGVYARYAPSGHLLVVTADGKLIAIPFDPKKLELTGAPVALIEGIGVRNGGFNIDLSLAGNGTLAYTTGGTLGSRRAVWVSREGVVSPVDPAWDPQGVIASASLSADGKAVAVDLSRDGRRDIWVKRLPDGPFSRITFGDTSSVRPAWSADGREVLYITDRSGSGVGPVYAHRADGTGTPRLLIGTPKTDFGQIAPSRDGRWLVLRTAPIGAGTTDIVGLKAGDTTLVPLVATPAGEFFPALSPDGRWLAYASERIGDARGLRPAVSRRPRRPSGRSPPRAAASRPGPAPAASCCTSTASPRWCRPRSRRAPPSRSGGSGRCSRWPSSPARAGPVVLAEPRRQAVPDGARGGDGTAERADRGGELGAGAGGKSREVRRAVDRWRGH